MIFIKNKIHSYERFSSVYLSKTKCYIIKPSAYSHNANGAEGVNATVHLMSFDLNTAPTPGGQALLAPVNPRPQTTPRRG